MPPSSLAKAIQFATGYELHSQVQAFRAIVCFLNLGKSRVKRWHCKIGNTGLADYEVSHFDPTTFQSTICDISTPSIRKNTRLELSQKY